MTIVKNRKDILNIHSFDFLFAGMLFKPFGKSDPRIKIALEKGEPLIHFALVCGAKSCPPIKTYSSDVCKRQHHGHQCLF